ncbi:yippee protein [Spatholobus suberectus]|nr:yippee protein [Spatholobus suberectus]
MNTNTCLFQQVVSIDSATDIVLCFSFHQAFRAIQQSDGGDIKSRSNRKQRRKKMGRIFVVELEGRSYRCKFCRTHLALADDLISRSFHCRRGKAYLFNNVVNFTIGALEERTMLSGLHTVADIFCCCCGQIIGWKYVILLSYPL